MEIAFLYLLSFDRVITMSVSMPEGRSKGLN